MDTVTRYVVTHVNTKDMRCMTFAHQGRNTHATQAEAQEHLDAVLNTGVNRNDIPGVFGAQSVGTFEVRPVECYPGHFDPITRYFEA